MRPSFTTCWRWLGVAALLVVVALPAQAQRTVTLEMNSATLPDTTLDDAMASGVQVRGCLDGCTGDQSMLPDGNIIAWNDNTTLIPSNDGGDYWNVSFQIPDNEALNFKFFFQQAEDVGIGGWEDGDNVNIAAGTGDVTLDLHYFNKTGGNQAYDWRPFSAGDDSVAVWFRVYMNTESAITKGYDPTDGSLVVSLRGNFGENGAVGSEGMMVDWGGADAVLMRESTDDTKPGYHLYSGLVRYPASSAGNTQSYKFYFTDNDINGGDGGYEDGDNRTFIIPDAGSDLTLYWNYYSNSPPVNNPVSTASVTFQVDVSPLSDAGIFNINTDMMQVRGGFNGWDCPDDNQDDCLLARIPGTFDFIRSIPITAVSGSALEYKYFVDSALLGDIGWEEPLDYGGGNRNFMFSGSTQEVGEQFFNGIRAGNVIPTGTGVDLTFQVDMTDAMSFPSDPFDPVEDSVFVQFEDPVWLLTQGYEPENPDLLDGSGGSVIDGTFLTDDDADGIYEMTITIMGPAYNGIGYRYLYGGFDTMAGDVLNVEGAGGFGPGRRRYRYITDLSGPFTFALDGFRLFGPNGDQMPWEVNPTGPFAPGDLPNSIANGQADPVTVAIEPTGGELPVSAQLRQNYPNPFTANTAIEYAVPRDGQVALVVYDLMGREVLRLVDGFQAANTYRVTFDASDLAAGVYVYQLRTGSTVQSHRMTLLK